MADVTLATGHFRDLRFRLFPKHHHQQQQQQQHNNMDSKQLGRVAGTPNQGETLARMCEDIRRRGLQATHFLVVFFRWGKEIPKSCKTKFRQMFFKFMTMKVVVELAEDDSVYVQWKSPNLKTSSMYYTTSRLVFFVFFLFSFVLFCFVLFCFVLFCFVLFCFVLFCFVLNRFVLFYLLHCILFCFVLFCFVLFCFVLFCFVLFCFVLY